MFANKKLALSMAAVAAGVAVIMAGVQAVNINPDGTGQVLIFPYFNAQAGYVTNINLVNSTDETKAIRIRFRDGKHSDDIQSFNIYMSPRDVWTGSVRLAEDNVSGSVTTRDRTCAIPALASCKTDAEGNKPDCEAVYSFGSVEDNATKIDTQEGYVEVIEMGIVTDAHVIAGVQPVNGVPRNCGVVETAFSDGSFTQGKGDVKGMTGPTGGLFGSAAVLNIQKGIAVSMSPIAIDNYSTIAQHYHPTDGATFLLPSLASGNVDTSNLLVATGGSVDLVETTWQQKGSDACGTVTPCGTNPYPIAHVLLATQVSNEFFVDPTNGYDGHTDWIVTFPMKKYGIFQADSDVSTTITHLYDREGTPASFVKLGDFGFKDEEPAKNPFDTLLNREVNVISFVSTDPSYDANHSVFQSHARKTLSVGPFVHGWAGLGFAGYGIGEHVKSIKNYGKSGISFDKDSPIYQGVPVIGFAALDGRVAENAGARFGDAFEHKYQRGSGVPKQ